MLQPPHRPARQRFVDQPYLLLTLSAFLWSTNMVLARLVAGVVPPAAVTLGRWAIASIVLVPLARPQLKRDWPALRADLPLIVLLAINGYVLNCVFSYYGLRETTALNAFVMQACGPLFIVFFALIVSGIIATPTQMLGLLISAMGVLLTVTRGNVTALTTIKLNWGDMFVLASNITFAFYSALLTKRRTYHPFSFMTIVAALAAILCVPLVGVETAAGIRMHFDLVSIATVIYVGLFPSLGATLCFNRGVELIGPDRAAPFAYTIPVFGSIQAILLLGEQLMWFHVTGYLLVVAGVIISARRR